MSTGTQPLTPSQEAIAAAKALQEDYLYRVIKGSDEFVNVLTGGNLGQSLSSRIGLDAAKGDPGAVLLAKALDLIEANHAVKAEAADEAQAEKVVQAEQSSPDLPRESLP
jgi:hypothetical protein